MAHDSGPAHAEVFGRDGAWIAQSPGSGQGVTGEHGDAVLQIAEALGGLGFAAPLDFSGID